VFLLVILFIVVPIAELYVIIQVGEAIGVVPTLLLLLLDAILGSLLLRHQGRGAWRRFNEALAQRRFPGKEVADGVLIVIGGTLLLAPGFLTDIVGLLLLIPPTRAIARAVLKRFTVGRFTVVGVPGGDGGAFGRGDGPGRGGQRANRQYDYDVTAEEVPTNGNGAGARELPRSDED
jgi:UPF0716 protein FxsA